MKKKILIINGNPRRNSLSSAISKAYFEGAVSSGHEVKELFLGDLKFDPVLWEEYSKNVRLEPDLRKSQKLIKWADHLVFVYPIWWHTVPALLKGWMDKVFLPSFGFKYEKGMRKPTKLLTGKTGEIIKTSGGPWWLHGLPGPTDNLLWRFGIFGFMGIKMKLFGVTHFHKIRLHMPEKRFQKIIAKARRLGEKV